MQGALMRKSGLGCDVFQCFYTTLNWKCGLRWGGGSVSVYRAAV